MSVGAQIRHVRERRLGLTQRELAARLRNRKGQAPDPVSVSRWERGKAEPSLNYIRQIAALAGVPLASFYDEDAA